MTLEDLPAFTVEDIAWTADGARLSGRFNHLIGVEPGTSYLYCGDGQWPGELEELDAETRHAIFTAPDWVQRDWITVGSVVPWLPVSWQFFHVNLILFSTWERRTFVPSDAQHFRIGDLHGWTKLGGPVDADCVLTHIEPGGWDHEECRICDKHVGRGGSPDGYANSADHWLCHACYERWGQTRDLGFIFAGNNSGGATSA